MDAPKYKLIVVLLEKLPIVIYVKLRQTWSVSPVFKRLDPSVIVLHYVVGSSFAHFTHAHKCARQGSKLAQLMLLPHVHDLFSPYEMLIGRNTTPPPLSFSIRVVELSVES